MKIETYREEHRRFTIARCTCQWCAEYPDEFVQDMRPHEAEGIMREDVELHLAAHILDPLGPVLKHMIIAAITS